MGDSGIEEGQGGSVYLQESQKGAEPEVGGTPRLLHSLAALLRRPHGAGLMPLSLPFPSLYCPALLCSAVPLTCPPLGGSLARAP